jgi:hypothetical protein
MRDPAPAQTWLSEGQRTVSQGSSSGAAHGADAGEREGVATS